ncbi:MAG: hypothetical protein ABSD79_03390 [Dehalococcoidales bacterium]|jgi:hypothetical protein
MGLINKKNKGWGIVSSVCFALFVIGSVACSSSPQIPTSTSVSFSNQPQASIQFNAGASADDTPLVVTNNGTNTWYGFKLTFNFRDPILDDPTYTRSPENHDDPAFLNNYYTETGLDQNMSFPPGRQLVFRTGSFVDSKGRNLFNYLRDSTYGLIDSPGVWPYGTYTITSITARLAPNGKYENISLAPGGNVFTVG